MVGKHRRHGSHKQDMSCLFHNETGGSNRVHDAFDRSDSTGLQVLTFHNRRVHSPDPVKLQAGSSTGIKLSASFKDANGLFDSSYRCCPSIKEMITDSQSSPEALPLPDSDRSGPSTTMGKNDGM